MDGKPTVTVLGDTLPSPFRRCTEQYLWSAILDRFRIRPKRFEVDELAVKFRGLLSPDFPHGQHAFAQHLPPVDERHAVVRHFLGVPSGAHT